MRDAGGDARCGRVSHRPLHVAASPRATTSACGSTAMRRPPMTRWSRRSTRSRMRAATSPLTYFEYGTLAAFWLFARAELDVGDPRGRAGRTARRRQRRRCRRRRRHERRSRSHGLPRSDARGHRPRESRHLSRGAPRGLRRAQSARRRLSRTRACSVRRCSLIGRDYGFAAHDAAVGLLGSRAARATGCRIPRCAARSSSRTRRRRSRRSISCATACT